MTAASASSTNPGLFGFVYNTLRKRANDPHNPRYWLPGKLQGADKPGGGGKLLPLQQDHWNIGAITGEAGATFRDSIRGQWWLSLQQTYKNDPVMSAKLAQEQGDHQAIACPDNPWPRLTFTAVTVFGLDNVLLLPAPSVQQSAEAYLAVVPLQLGYYDGQGGLPTLSQLHVEGDYTISQCVCSAPADTEGPPPTACDGWIPGVDITGRGKFAVTLNNVWIDATIELRVTGTGAGRSIQAAVRHLELRGPTPGSMPELAIDEDPQKIAKKDPFPYKLTVETEKGWQSWLSVRMWLPMAKKALESDDGRRGLFANLNASINEQGNRDQLAQLLTQRLGAMFDDTLGRVPGGALPSQAGQQTDNAVDQYLFDRTRYALNDPASDYYLPKAVLGSEHPVLEPYHIDSISLGDQSFQQIQFQDLRLEQVQVTGLSNTTAPPDRMVFRKGELDTTLALSALTPPPQVTVKIGGQPVTRQVPASPLTATGQFSMAARGFPQRLGGSFVIRVEHSTVTGTMTLSGQVLEELVIGFQHVQLQASPGATQVEVKVESSFKDIINQVMNQESIKTRVLVGINEKLAGNLGDIGKTATENARRLIASRLDG